MATVILQTLWRRIRLRTFQPAHGSTIRHVGYETFERQRDTNLPVKLPRYILSFGIKTYILRAEQILFDDNHCEFVTITQQYETFIRLHCTPRGSSRSAYDYVMREVVHPRQSSNVTVTNVGRNSSAGRALDWRSKGPWFDPGFRHFLILSRKVSGHTHSAVMSNYLCILK